MKFTITVLALIAIVFTIGCGSSDDKLSQDVQSAAMTGKTAEKTMDIVINAATIAKGKSIYQLSCASCHGSMGKGDGPAAIALNPKPRDHTNGAYMDKLSNAHLFYVIRNGGVAYGYPTMPAQPNLSEEEIKEVVAFVRSLSSTYHPVQ